MDANPPQPRLRSVPVPLPAGPLTLPAADRLPPALRAAGPVLLTVPPAFVLAALIALAGPLVALGIVVGLLVAALVVTYPMAGVVLGIALIPAEVYTLPLGPVGLTPSETLFVLAGSTFAARRLLGSATPLEPSPMTAPVLLLLAAMVPGIFFAIDLFSVVKTIIMWSTFACVMWLVISTRDRAAVELLLLTLALAGAVVAVIAVSTAGPQRLVGSVAEGRAQGAFGSPNTLASFLALALPGALALSLRGRLGTRAIALGCTAAIFVGLALSLSRGGLLAAIGALGLMLLWGPVRKVVTAGAVVVVLRTVNGAAIISANEPIARVTQRLATIGGSSEGADPRFIVWPRIPEIVADSPLFGVGVAQFGFVSERRGLTDPLLGAPFDHAHNLVLNYAAELGLIGLGAILWLGIALARICLAACRRGRDDLRGPAFAVTAALAAFTLHGMVDVTLRTNVIAALLFVLVGCAVVLSRAHVGEPGAGAAGPRPWLPRLL